MGNTRSSKNKVVARKEKEYRKLRLLKQGKIARLMGTGSTRRTST